MVVLSRRIGIAHSGCKRLAAKNLVFRWSGGRCDCNRFDPERRTETQRQNNDPHNRARNGRRFHRMSRSFSRLPFEPMKDEEKSAASRRYVYPEFSFQMIG